uniref:DUF3615 domain-containing protein n=1 Tax=Arundo donax TaxID=35708 RepID=A0A0A9BVB8_ARUDO
MDGGDCYMHMNFKARNVKTRSEKLFFAELVLNGSVSDGNGYSTTACSIVGDNCVGGMKHLLGNGLPKERYDEQHCYVCAEEIKHPPGMSYKGGHYAEDYCIGGLE